jgi:hypothetical protein
MSSINSPYDKDERTTIRNLTWTNSSSGTKRCTICFEKTRMIVKQVDGMDVFWCHSCGSTEPVAPGETAADSRYTSRYGTTMPTNSFIISQDKNRKKKGRREGELDADDLALLGSSGAGASKVDERTIYTDSQGGTY